MFSEAVVLGPAITFRVFCLQSFEYAGEQEKVNVDSCHLEPGGVRTLVEESQSSAGSTLAHCQGERPAQLLIPGCLAPLWKF